LHTQIQSRLENKPKNDFPFGSMLAQRKGHIPKLPLNALSGQGRKVSPTLVVPAQAI
jgi:hypothetical protein